MHAGQQRRRQAGGRPADRDIGATEEGEDKSGDDRRDQTADRRRTGGNRNPERERDPHHGDLQPRHQVVPPMLQPRHPVLGFLDCWNIVIARVADPCDDMPFLLNLLFPYNSLKLLALLIFPT